jgi:hypothetical protein
MTRDLAALQRAMAELVLSASSVSSVASVSSVVDRFTTEDTEDAESYIDSVRGSTGLEVLRRCIVEWRLLLLRRACPLTAGALESTGQFEEAVECLLERTRPPFLRELALDFLDEVRERHPHVADVAGFEAEMIREYS